MKNIAVLGSTGSIGRSAAAVIAANPGRFRLYAAVARRNSDELARQCALLHPAVVALTDENAARDLGKRLPAGVKMLSGGDHLVEAATLPEVDTVLCAVTGVAGVPAPHADRAGGVPAGRRPEAHLY